MYWPDLDRSRVDPTIFERSFKRTLGLARLLVLERLPTSSARDAYLDKRREERGRPSINRYRQSLLSLAGNIKDEHEDEVADWVSEEDVSNYNTFTVPCKWIQTGYSSRDSPALRGAKRRVANTVDYLDGPRFHAKRIEKLCYTRDLRAFPIREIRELGILDLTN